MRRRRSRRRSRREIEHQRPYCRLGTAELSVSVVSYMFITWREEGESLKAALYQRQDRIAKRISRSTKTEQSSESKGREQREYDEGMTHLIVK